jgi:Zn ribbon nucleic-acid-binding protein
LSDRSLADWDGLPLPGACAGRTSSETESVSEKHAVECLRCGHFRTIERGRNQRLEPGECLRCGYLGWALIADLSNPVRRTLRERPPEVRGRRLRAV